MKQRIFRILCKLGIHVLSRTYSTESVRVVVSCECGKRIDIPWVK
jgi:hypothetical protein